MVLSLGAALEFFNGLLCSPSREWRGAIKKVESLFGAHERFLRNLFQNL